QGGLLDKYTGDGIMAVFADPTNAVRAALAAREALDAVEVEGYRPRMRVGIHTGRPQRIGSDWLGIDVNLAARVMERAPRGELIVSEATLERIDPADLEALGVTARKLRKQVFGAKQEGVPPDFTMYQLRIRRQLPVDGDDEEAEDDAVTSS
ncbi:MAG: adenylate/guanylate cyclase domain-containing protein, partial [Mycobacterium sp.]